MDQRRPPEYTLNITADRSSAKDVIKAVLHTIFFHRLFTAIYPATHDVLDITLPYVSEDDVETTIEQRTTSFLRQLDITTSASPSPQQYSNASRSRGQLVVHFLERKRRKSGWFIAKADEETVWEIWIIDVNLTGARSEPEAARNRRLMEQSLEEAAMKVITSVNEEKSHIPPITTNESNPFPYQILINPKADSLAQRASIF